MKKGSEVMTKKLWFQVGIGVLIILLILKYFIEIYWIFSPLVIILNTIFVPLLLGGVLFYITAPVQAFMEKKGMPRWGSLTTILLLLVGVITGFTFLVGNPIATQINRLVHNAPYIGEKLQEATDYVLANRNNLPPQVEEIINSVTASLQDIAVASSKWLVSFVGGAVSVTLTLVLVPFFFIFMLKDHEKFAPKIYNLFSGERRAWFKNTLEEMNHALQSFVQGQVLVSFILALIMFIGYLIIGLEYSLLLALFAFLMNMIPFIGPWVSLVPAVVIALIQDPVLVIWVCVITLIAQQVESNLITPNVMGKSLDIHPLTVITLVLAGGNIAGLYGIILAIPTYAVLKVIVQNIYDERKKIKQAAIKSI